MKNVYLFFLFILISSSSFCQNEVVIRISPADNNTYNYFAKAQDEITAYRTGDFIDVLVNPDRLNQLKSDWNFTITQTAERNKQNLGGNAKDIAGYHTYDEAVAYLQQIATDYPNICSLSDIGDSHGKQYYDAGANGYSEYQHDIWMLKISDNVSDEEDEPAVFFLGDHHAREPISTEVTLGIIQYLTDNYGIDDQITYMIDHTEIYIVPMVNPDGHEVVLDQLNTWWRKNAADGDNNGQFNYNSGSYDGVDPNRNYGWNWGGEGSSGDRTSETYHGPSVFSEPEIASIRDLMAAHHFTSGITYHSYSELVLYPYGYSVSCLAPDHQALEELAVNMAESIPRIIGSGHYTPEQSNDLYPASGVTDDWAYGHHGIFCFTVELGQEFIPPSPQVPNIISDNIEAAMMVLNRPNVKTLRGHVYDAETMEVVSAEVFVSGIDDNGASYREPYKSDEAYGAYYRLLTAGSFDVTFSAYGYISQSFEDVLIKSDTATFLDVYLEKSESIDITGSVLDGNTGENIEGASITILNTPLDPVYTDINGVYSMDDVSFDTYSVKVEKDGYAPLIVEQTVDNTHYILNFVLLPAEAIDFESGEFGDEFTMSGNQPWMIDNTVYFEGDYSAVSGNIGDYQTSTMILNTENRSAGVIRFYRKVSTEAGYDYLKFYIDGEKQEQWAGELDWEQVSFDITEGDHEFKWSYERDANTGGGTDQTWVDFIEIPPVVTTVVNAGPDMSICNNGETAQLNAFAANYNSLSWTSSGDGSFSQEDILNPIYTPGVEDIANGQVELSITASGSETVSDVMLLSIELCTGIEQISQEAKFMMSPNPSNGRVKIDLITENGGLIEIYNASGSMVNRRWIVKGQTTYFFNFDKLPAGVYFVRYVNSASSSNIQRLLIQ